MRTHWDRHAETWDAHLPSSDLFAELLDEVFRRARPDDGSVAADLGAGSGFLTIPLMDRTPRVYAVDNSEQMLAKLLERVGDDPRLHIERCSFLTFEPAEPLDVVVSNYALHHLRGPAKAALVERTFAQLRPGGRFVVSDIMVPLTLRPGNSSALRSKVWRMTKKGLPGFWRIAKNGVRWVRGTGEYPVGPETWMTLLNAAGFTGVGHTAIGRETGVVWGTKPSAPTN
jgi:SAM-dependent methyltransferase